MEPCKTSSMPRLGNVYLGSRHAEIRSERDRIPHIFWRTKSGMLSGVSTRAPTPRLGSVSSTSTAHQWTGPAADSRVRRTGARFSGSTKTARRTRPGHPGTTRDDPAHPGACTSVMSYCALLRSIGTGLAGCGREAHRSRASSTSRSCPTWGSTSRRSRSRRRTRVLQLRSVGELERLCSERRAHAPVPDPGLGANASRTRRDRTGRTALADSRAQRAQRPGKVFSSASTRARRRSPPSPGTPPSRSTSPPWPAKHASIASRRTSTAQRAPSCTRPSPTPSM